MTTRLNLTLIFPFLSLVAIFMVMELSYRTRTSFVQQDETIVKYDSREMEKEYKEMVEKCTYQPITTYEEFKHFALSFKVACKQSAFFGGGLVPIRNQGGVKKVCVDKSMELIEGNCTVISLGVFNDWTFDYAMDNFGCKVYSLDPTMNLEKHRRRNNIFFYPIGLGPAYQEPATGNNKISERMTYSSLLDFLGLRNQIIDYLKVDIESAEIEAFLQILNDYPHVLGYVKQIGIEIHPVDNIPKALLYYEILQKITCLGFSRFYSAANQLNNLVLDGEKVPCCYDMIFINKKFSTEK